MLKACSFDKEYRLERKANYKEGLVMRVNSSLGLPHSVTHYQDFLIHVQRYAPIKLMYNAYKEYQPMLTRKLPQTSWAF